MRPRRLATRDPTPNISRQPPPAAGSSSSPTPLLTYLQTDEEGALVMHQRFDRARSRHTTTRRATRREARTLHQAPHLHPLLNHRGRDSRRAAVAPLLPLLAAPTDRPRRPVPRARRAADRTDLGVIRIRPSQGNPPRDPLLIRQPRRPHRKGTIRTHFHKPNHSEPVDWLGQPQTKEE